MELQVKEPCRAHHRFCIAHLKISAGLYKICEGPIFGFARTMVGCVGTVVGSARSIRSAMAFVCLGGLAGKGTQ